MLHAIRFLQLILHFWYLDKHAILATMCSLCFRLKILLSLSSKPLPYFLIINISELSLSMVAG
jgi:hypothetical protein